MWHAVVHFYGIRPLGRGAPPEPGLGPDPVRDLAREILRSTQEMHTARPSDVLGSSESSVRRSCARLVPSSASPLLPLRGSRDRISCGSPCSSSSARSFCWPTAPSERAGKVVSKGIARPQY